MLHAHYPILNIFLCSFKMRALKFFEWKASFFPFRIIKIENGARIAFGLIRGFFYPHFLIK